MSKETNETRFYTVLTCFSSKGGAYFCDVTKFREITRFPIKILHRSTQLVSLETRMRLCLGLTGILSGILETLRVVVIKYYNNLSQGVVLASRVYLYY